MGFGKGYGCFLRGVGRGKFALATDDSIVLAMAMVSVPTSLMC